ncbi:MAG TPA: adenosine deaminase [Candidatus Caccenecus avistercoris]|nr:adenosine deaminase [Candidatus Caccenecus avistercoris]
MKKVELHLHLDGSIRPSTISEILNINLEEAKKLSTIETKCASLKEYLTKFDIPLKIMQTKENLERVAFELAQDLQKDDVIYAEIRFAPNKHLKSGLTLDEVVTAILKGLSQVPIKTNLILCMMRGDSYEQNLKVIKLAKKYLNHGVVAIDLAGSEASYPVNLYQELFEIAQKENIPFTIHAGEADEPLSVINAINLGAKRIGHGVRAIESEKALKLIKEKNITLEVCPKSNLDTNMYEKLSNHPIKKLYDMGLLVTINTDNRTVSNTNLTKSYQDLQEVFSFTKQDFLKMNENALQSAFLNQAEIEELLALLHK